MHFSYIYYIFKYSRSIKIYNKKLRKVHFLEVVIYIIMKMHGKHSIQKNINVTLTLFVTPFVYIKIYFP
jgi:hypothetical protein